MMDKHIVITTRVIYQYEVDEKFDINNDNALTALMSNGTPTVTLDDVPVEVKDSTESRYFNYEG
jgi:hypothetical protein